MVVVVTGAADVVFTVLYVAAIVSVATISKVTSLHEENAKGEDLWIGCYIKVHLIQLSCSFTKYVVVY